MADAKAFSEPTKEYRLKDGKQHSHGGTEVRPGDVVNLNATQAVAFRDKFEAVDENAPFKDYGPDVHKKFFHNAANRAAQEAGLGPVAESDEAAQAQKDKALAESKASGSGPGSSTAVSTFDHSSGTLTKDPGASAPVSSVAPKK